MQGTASKGTARDAVVRTDVTAHAISAMNGGVATHISTPQLQRLFTEVERRLRSSTFTVDSSRGRMADLGPSLAWTLATIRSQYDPSKASSVAPDDTMSATAVDTSDKPASLRLYRRLASWTTG